MVVHSAALETTEEVEEAIVTQSVRTSDLQEKRSTKHPLKQPEKTVIVFDVCCDKGEHETIDWIYHIMDLLY